MSDTPRQLPLELTLQPGLSGDDLVVTSSNHAVFQLIEQWPQWPLPVALIIGPEGAGKTHFATVWAQKVGAFHASLKAMDEAIVMAGKGIPILLEDIDSKPFDETAFFHLINSVRQGHSINHHASLLMTARTSPQEWELGLLDLASRMKQVMFVEIEQPDDDLLSAVLIKLLADRQMEIDTVLINYIISRIERSLSALQHFAVEVDRLALARKSRINRQIASEVIESLSGDHAQSNRS